MDKRGTVTSLIQLRHAAMNDAQALEKLVELAYRGGKADVAWKNEHDLVQGPRTNAAEIAGLIASPKATILIAEITERGAAVMVGCILIEKITDNDVTIGLFAVDPKQQNMGLGRQLVRAAEAHAREHFGCQRSTMWVLGGRSELLDWYKRLGYAETGETKPFPVEDGEQRALTKNPHFVVIRRNIVD